MIGKRRLSGLTVLLGLLLVVTAGCADKKEQSGQTGGKAPATLLVYSGAGLNKPVEEIGAVFEKQTGIKVTYTFGGSAQLNSQILFTKKGDVYLPGDVQELEPLSEYRLIRSGGFLCPAGGYFTQCFPAARQLPAGKNSFLFGERSIFQGNDRCREKLFVLVTKREGERLALSPGREVYCFIPPAAINIFSW